MCVVVNGEWLPPNPNLVKCRPRQHLANPLVEGLRLVNWVLLVRPNHTISRTSLLLWGVLYPQVRLSAPSGEGVVLVLLSQILGMAGVLALEAALVLELGFLLYLGLGLAPRIGPNLYPLIPW
jgi:hypothetical protein